MRAAVALHSVLLIALLAGCVDHSVPGKVVETVPAEQEPEEFRVVVAPPESGSPRAQALIAMQQAQSLVLYSLQPWAPPPPPPPGWSDDAWYAKQEETRDERCRRTGCIQRDEVLGKVVVSPGADMDVVRAALRESLSQVPDYATACAAVFRHAIEFRAQGQLYQIPLCYDCGKVAVVVDGEFLDGGQAHGMGDEKALNAILAREGIPIARDPILSE